MTVLYLAIIIQSAVYSPNPEINAFLDSGDYDSAYRLLLDEAERKPDDELNICLLGMTAPAGKRSSLYLKEYLQKYPGGREAPLVRRNLLDYYAASGLRITAGRLYGQDLADNVDGPEDIYRIAVVRQGLGEFDGAARLYREVARDAPGELEIWARLGIADCNLLNGDLESARKEYLSVIDRFPNSSPLPFALVGLSETFRRQGKMDEARAYYELYREKFELAPGSMEIEAALVETGNGHSEDAIQSLLDVDYFVQVGIFAHESNANVCLKKFRNLGHRSRIQDFSEGGRTFFRVLVGPYSSEKKALAEKENLEKSQGEKYLIILQ
jgi:tetratricopeptide (TPR) repeat protein